MTETSGETPIRLGISSCFLGARVRYDRGHRLNHYLVDSLGQFVQWVPVCPEVETGMPIPREALRLVGNPEAPRRMAQINRLPVSDWVRQQVYPKPYRQDLMSPNHVQEEGEGSPGGNQLWSNGRVFRKLLGHVLAISRGSRDIYPTHLMIKYCYLAI